MDKANVDAEEYYPDTIKPQEQLEKSAQKLTQEQREVYNSRVEQKLNEFNEKRQHQTEQSKSQEKE